MQTESVMAYLHRLKNTKLTCGKTLLELTTYNDVALWWFADVAFHFYLFNRKYELSGEEAGLHHTIKTSSLFMALVRRVYYLSDYLLALFAYLTLLWFNRTRQVKLLGQEGKTILITGADIEWRTFYAGDQVKPILSDQFFHAIIQKLNKKGIYRVVSTYP